MFNEITSRGFRSNDSFCNDFFAVEFAISKDIVNIRGSLLYVAFNIHGETWSFGNGETEVQCDASGDAAQTDEYAPHEIDSFQVTRAVMQKPILVRGDDDKRNKASG